MSAFTAPSTTELLVCGASTDEILPYDSEESTVTPLTPKHKVSSAERGDPLEPHSAHNQVPPNYSDNGVALLEHQLQAVRRKLRARELEIDNLKMQNTTEREAREDAEDANRRLRQKIHSVSKQLKESKKKMQQQAARIHRQAAKIDSLQTAKRCSSPLLAENEDSKEANAAAVEEIRRSLGLSASSTARRWAPNLRTWDDNSCCSWTGPVVGDDSPPRGPASPANSHTPPRSTSRSSLIHQMIASRFVPSPSMDQVASGGSSTHSRSLSQRLSPGV